MTHNGEVIAADPPSTRQSALSTETMNRLKGRAATAALAVATVLIATKAVAAMLTGSVSLLSSLVDSTIDLLASLVNFIAIRQAAQPADKEHRFGHGKAEPLAGLAQAAFVGGSAAFLLFQAVVRLIQPVPIQHSQIGLAVMGLSIVLTLLLVAYQHHVVRKTNSLAISADSLHYKSDVLVNASVIIALILSTQFALPIADPLIAIGITAYIFYSAWKILVASLNVLMDRELPEADRRRILELALAHPQVISVHDLRTRSTGVNTFIQFHLELDGGLTLHAAHAISDEVMEAIEAAFPNAEVLIHEDPHGVPERRLELD